MCCIVSSASVECAYAPPARISAAIIEVFDLRPAAIIRDLDLLRPIYAPTAAYGHFGRTDIELPWESRQELLEKSRRVAGMHPMRDAFEAVGTSRPVSLTREDKVGLVGVIDLFAGDTEGGFGGLPEGIVELRDALRDDLHAVHSQLTAQVLRATPDDDPAPGRIASWEDGEAVTVARAAATLEEICADDQADLARMSVGLRVVRGLLSS